MSKGSRSRVTDRETYARSWERIFGRAKAIERKRNGSDNEKQQKALLSSTETGKPPNPGSPEAVALGCKCPVLDNHNGTGSDWGPGTFWYIDGCPVHCVPQWEALKKAVGADKPVHPKTPKLSRSQSRRLNVQRGFYRIRKD
jgi:hypothetical protein